MTVRAQMKIVLVALVFLTAAITGFGAEPPRKILPGHVISVTNRLMPRARLAATNELSLAIGLPLRNEAALDELLRQLYDPRSTNFHKFLTSSEFTARFGPTEADYEAVKNFARTNGFTIAGTHGNRLVLDVTGKSGDAERAFHVALKTFRHPREPRNFFAPDTEPSVPTNLMVADIWGLSDYPTVRPLSRKIDPLQIRPLGGTGPSGYYAGQDFRNAYAPGTPLNGAGQTVGLLQFDGYNKRDITNYENMVGMTHYVSLTNVTLNFFNGSAGGNNNEVCLDIEMAIAMAPGLARIIVYEGNPSSQFFNPSSVLSQMASDNLAQQLSSSWSWSGGPASTVDSALKQMITQGQSFFQASGDSDAYTGAQALDNSSQTTAPMDSTNVISVGGTTLSMNGSGASWSSETVWNYHIYGGANANVGSGGGISTYYTIPWWQTNIDTNVSQGSATFRNIPDVALTADGVSVCYTSGSAVTNALAGTSCAAPLWAGFCALLNQQSVASSGTPVGFINPAIYALATTTNYANCFHDIATGNNIGTNTAGMFYATNGYDLATGLGTPNGTNLINALAPLASPFFISQPAGLNTTNGANVTFNVSALGAPPLNFQWLLNGTNLPAAGNVTGTTGGTLAITAATTNNSGSYQLVVSNAYNSITSSVAVLNVGFAPTVSVSPASLTLFAGSNAVFTASSGGSSPFGYKWKRGGTNFAGANITGTNAATLTIASAITNNSGSYTVVVTNLFGSVTSSVASLLVVVPAAITNSSITNRTVECSKNTNNFTLTAIGTAPLGVQWSFNGTPVSGATNASFSLTNLSVSTNIVSVAVTNFYGSATSNATLAVRDTLAPVITLIGASRVTNELGLAFTDLGATANDTCAGSITVAISGAVITNAVGTNTLTYTASDGNGNTARTNRTVIVRDTTPPVVSWSFTNLIVAANSSCVALMANVTGTNFILATDLSGSVTVTQSPTNNAALQLGTNTVVLTVADASGNKSYSTNRVIVSDQTPPVFVSQPSSRTNFVGTTANFSVAASACTALSYQWFFNSAPLTARTNFSLSLSNLTTAAAGNYFAVATAAGGSSTSAVATLTVNLNPSVVVLASSANPDGFKNILNFTAAVTPTNATGTIQFLTNGSAFDLKPLVTGAATSTNLSTLPRGTNFIAAIYSGDAGDLPATNMLAQIVTNHPPQVAPAFYPLLAGLNLAIAVADLATNWSDADGDLLSIAFINASTNGVTVTNALPNLFYSNPNYVSDQFVCAVSDSFGGTNFQTVNITIVPQTNATPAISSVVAPPPGGISLQLNGAYGSTYVLESTGDLAAGNWQPVATNTLGLTGVWQFTDFSVTNNPVRFYRLKLVQ